MSPHWAMLGTMDVTKGRACTHCGDERLDEGFIEDTGQGASGFARWIAGPLERGLFGGAKRMGRNRRQILAFRCVQCGHLELFADIEVTTFP